MNPNEHNSRRAVRFTFVGVMVVVVGLVVAIYNREIREHLGLRRDSVTGSQPSLVEPSILDTNNSSEISLSDNSVTDLERPIPYEPFGIEADLTKNKSDICPVHHVKMPPKAIDLAFPNCDPNWASEFRTRKDAEFPFACAYIHGGYVGLVAPPTTPTGLMNCILDFPPPRWVRLFICPQCLPTYKSAVSAFDAQRSAMFKARQAEEAKRATPRQQQR